MIKLNNSRKRVPVSIFSTYNLILLACLILPNLSCGQSIIEVVSPKDAVSGFYSGFYNIGKWETKAPMPRAKEDFALISLNNKLYALGGDAGNVWLADNDVYDIDANKWEKKTPMSKNRSGVAAAAVDGKIYVIGGFDGSAADTDKWLNTVEAYDPATDKWEAKSSMVTQRGGLGVGVIDNKIYAVGGNISKADWLDKLEVYNPADDTWQAGLPSMQVARTQVAVGVANNRLYVFGGENKDGVLDVVEEYDPRGKKWRTRAPMPTPRTNAEVAVKGNNIFVMGGRDKSDIEVYNVNTNKWEKGKNLPGAREGFGSQIAADGNTIYVSGGKGAGILDTLEAGSIEKK